MTQKQRLFIYDRREIGVLILLGVIVALFAFTLGIHLGKQVGGKVSAAQPVETNPLSTIADQVPERNDMNEQSKGVASATDLALSDSLKEEVQRTGITLSPERQVDLPKNISHPASHGRYTLQIGAFQTIEDAHDRLDKLTALGVKPILRPVDIKEKGRWYRLYLGDYPSVDAAKEAGEKFSTQKIIDSFVVSNQVN